MKTIVSRPEEVEKKMSGKSQWVYSKITNRKNDMAYKICSICDKHLCDVYADYAKCYVKVDDKPSKTYMCKRCMNQVGIKVDIYDGV